MDLDGDLRIIINCKTQSKMKKINYRTKTHNGWIIINVDLPKFMEYFKKSSPEWYVKRGNKNEVKGRIDGFGKFILENNKDVVPAEFYFLIDKKTFALKLIVVNGRHRLAWMLENGYKEAIISIPKNQKSLFKEFE
jgi:hypothetical protein